MKKTKREPLVLANWGRRFITWFVDYLIINVMLAYFGLEQIETQMIPRWLLPHLPGFDISIWSPLSVLVFFVYWTFSEWYFGRSIGQLLLNLRLVDARRRRQSEGLCFAELWKIAPPSIRLLHRLGLSALPRAKAAILQQVV